jgi:hypothetical protein
MLHLGLIKNTRKKPNKKLVNKNKNKPNYKKRKAIIQLDKNNNFIQEYDSIKSAVKQLNLKQCANGNIVACCKGKANTAYNYKWLYKY